MYTLPILNLGQGEVYNIINDKVNQWLATGWWFSQGIPVSSTNKTDSHDITEILLKVALNTIKTKTKPILKILTEFRFHWFANTWIMEPFIIHHKYYNNERKILSICIHHELWKYSPNSDFVDLSVLGLRSHSTYSDWHHYSFDKTEYSYYSPNHLYHLIKLVGYYLASRKWLL